MANVISPNMSLIVPGVGSEAGPTYAQDINNDLNILDAHTHTPGSGVQITPAALNINSALTLNSNFLNSIAGLTLTAQGSTPVNNTIYESGVDLYYVDGNGNNVRITQSGGVAGSPGSISNLTSPASASYVSSSKTFVWQSNTAIAANLDAASILLRNISPNSTFALTLSPPASLSNNYTITLPTVPASQSFMTIDNSGAIAAPVVYPLVASGIANNTITAAQIANNTITATEIANGAITTTQISATANITATQINPNAAINPNQLASYTTGGSPYFVQAALNSQFTTGSTSFVQVTAFTATLTNQSTQRPTFITFSGTSSSTAAFIEVPPLNGSSGLQQAIIQIRAISGLSSSVVATYAISNGTTVAGFFPYSMLNTVDFFSLGNVYEVWARVTVSNSFTSSIIINNNAVMNVFQV